MKIEFGCRTDTEPLATPEITPYLAEALPEQFPASTFTVRTVAPQRTFWEKAMLLHEEKFRLTDGPPRKERLARHYYDLWCMISQGVAQTAMENADLFEKVATHRQLVFGLKWVDYRTLCKGSLDMIPSAEQLPAWRKDYAAMREVMFFDDPPTFDLILQQVQLFQDGFNSETEIVRP